jgi:hypothetical protein
MRARVVVSACGAALAAACAATAPPHVLLPLAPALAGTSEGARRAAANNTFRESVISDCVRATRPAGVRALTFDGAQLPFSVAAGHEPGSRPRCRPGELRILRLQALRIGGQRTYVRRGGCALPCVVRQATVHVPASTLARPVGLLPPSVRNGNGASVENCRQEVRNAPQRVGADPHRMYYKTPAELRERRNAGRSGGAGARWSNYGDPGRTYRSPAGRVAHYNYLLWNLPRSSAGLLPGGGIVEAILRRGQPIALCAGQRLSLPSFDKRGAPNGQVDFGYAMVRGAAQAGESAYAIYGWVLLGYRYAGGAYTSTTTGSTIGRRLMRS